ncbi:tetratricopeptide repeat protein [Amycolatopsis cihanbeyliensis]|uniref:tetratricopeptide repeat protein n=1 Tax=Amycolatopsis cihanbeyliensis TaxID=1128664 RepID=UPI001151C9BA|nr:tetratricopeptide repeat protein [Amycolatopsis cihanbeyliensis]
MNKVDAQVGGNVVQAGYVHTINATAAVPTALAGLPADEGFTGRVGELAALAAAMATDGASVTAIAGPPGVGKSALAVRAARLALDAGEFPGGVLFVNVHGYDQARRIEAHAALGALLRALGVLGEHIPYDQGAREILYRSALATAAQDGKRILVVADNCATTDQVLPLQPGTAHRLLVTSRHSLPIPAARRIALGILPPAEAVTVLDDAVRTANPADDRVAAGATAAAELASLCGYLPLALRISAHMLADQPDIPIAELAEVLASSPIRGLEFGDSVAVRIAFDTSYARLPVDEARLFRLMSLHAGPHIGLDAASNLVGEPPTVTRRLLDGLRRAHLIEPAGSGRYQWHDLLRLYAAERCAQEDTADESTAAVKRVIIGYLAGAVSANTVVDPTIETPSAAPFADVAAALSWFDLERPNLVAAVAQAADTSHHQHVVDLARALFSYLNLNKFWSETLTVNERAVAAARQLGDREEEAYALVRLGVTYRSLRRYDDSLTSLRSTLAIQEATGDTHGRGSTMNALGTTYRDMGRFNEAEQWLDTALDLCRQTGNWFGEATALNTLATIRRRQGHSASAIKLLRRALAIKREVGDRYGEAMTLNTLASAYHNARRSEAEEHYLQALAIKRETGDRHGEAISLNGLGRLYREAGRYDEALSCLTEALQVRRSTGDMFGEAITLEELGTTYRDLGRIDDAMHHYQLALAEYEQNSSPRSVTRVADRLARLASTAGQPGRR